MNVVLIEAYKFSIISKYYPPIVWLVVICHTFPSLAPVWPSSSFLETGISFAKLTGSTILLETKVYIYAYLGKFNQLLNSIFGHL